MSFSVPARAVGLHELASHGNRGRPAGTKGVARKARRRRKPPAKADTLFAKLPTKFTIDDVRKVAGKAAPISLAQWARSKKVMKTAGGYQKAA